MSGKAAFDEARRAALKYILFKKRTVYEVEKKLENSGFSEDVISKVTAHYLELKYLDDELYTEKFIEEWKRLKYESYNKLIVRLKKKGISESIIYKCVDYSETDELEKLEKCFVKKYGEVDGFDKQLLDDVQFSRKFYYFFSSRGFSFELINRLLNPEA